MNLVVPLIDKFVAPRVFGGEIMEKNETLKLGLKLFIITAIAGLILGGAFVITKKPIADQVEKQILKQ